jgi:hypothetical protein
MTQFAFATRSHIRNVFLCTLATLTLAACGGEDGSTSAAAVSTDSSDAAASLIEPNAGFIDRSQGIDDSVPAGAGAGVTTATATASTGASTGSTTGSTSGSGSSSKPPVQTGSAGVATLDWTPPTENTDGTALTNLAGYTVYYGTSPDSLTKSIKVSNPGLTAFTVTDLPAGTWYFAVTSYSSTGVESGRTGTVSAKI